MPPGSDVLEALAAAVYTTDAEGRITFYNQAAAELWGHRPQLGTDQWCGSWRLHWPDGRLLPHDECPMAVALKEGRTVRGVEAIAERPDGTRVRFMPFPTPLRDESGNITGAVNLLVDVTGREREHLESAQLAAIVASSDDAIVSKTLEGRITSWNAGASRIFGYEPDEMIGQPIMRIIPPELHDEEKDIISRLRRGERIDHYETVRVAKDGRRIDVSLTVSPIRDRTGTVVGASKVARDITEHKQAQKLQQLLVEELNHRVKNTLAIVQAIASQSLRRSPSPADFVESFAGRIQALAKAHVLLTRTRLQGAELSELVREQVQLGPGGDIRISSAGPLLVLDTQTSVHLALILHELATNARKYGALSVPGGRLSLNWEIHTNGGRDLLLQWRESDGPMISAPTTRGFGTTLIEQTVQAHGGHVSMNYGARGLVCEMRVPLPKDTPMSVPKHAESTGTAPSEAPWRGDRSKLAGKRFLIIEDEPLVAMELEESLSAVGCEIVGPAGTVAAAAQTIARANCDAALLDVNLGGLAVDGLAAALAEKKIPFAFVTGYGREALPHAFREAIMLGKPFTRAQLVAVAETLIYDSPTVIPWRRKSA